MTTEATTADVVGLLTEIRDLLAGLKGGNALERFGKDQVGVVGLVGEPVYVGGECSEDLADANGPSSGISGDDIACGLAKGFREGTEFGVRIKLGHGSLHSSVTGTPEGNGAEGSTAADSSAPAGGAR